MLLCSSHEKHGPYLLQQLVGLCQTLQQLVIRAHREHLGVLHHLVHRAPPRCVNCLELAALIRHLLHNVLRPKDGLQVQPALLALEPLVQDLLGQVQLRFPQPHLGGDNQE